MASRFSRRIFWSELSFTVWNESLWRVIELEKIEVRATERIVDRGLSIVGLDNRRIIGNVSLTKWFLFTSSRKLFKLVL